ncbi:hypothetical protein PPACK8108_LOCUS23603 [Phakopsora pachyrhizi]|uniref:Uncharacterized protein n=1 Tax=Phakopsora pachyrhizi TaxID=170000 RepID=A0AAV0BPQ3_PHAPC|nr:hypothetical protein PPACK8108_LOCUS23603 [Phakopsora pachyrhizi]
MTLQPISSAQARSQPGTPLEARDSNQQVEPGDGVDIFLPSKPKSRLRQMAEKSARKYSITSLPPQIDCSQPDIVLDLGTPTPARINTPAVNYRPSSRRRSSPRRSSLASRKSLSPIKPAQTPVESLLDRLKLSERGSPLDHKHTTLDGKGSIFSSVLGDSVEHLPQISKHRSSLSLNPPSKLNSQQHSEDESDSISSVQDSNDKPECNEISEVFEALECDLQDGDKNLVGGIEEEEPIICQKNKSLNKNTRSKLVVEDSDSDDNFHVSTSRARNSSILAQQDTSISLNSEVVSTDSGDSGEVLPSRAVQLRETRLKALEKIANKKQFKLSFI